MPNRTLSAAEPHSLSASTCPPSSPTASARAPRANCHTCLFKPHCVPADLGGEKLERFERAVGRPHRPLKAGQVLVRQGDPMEALYALRVGSLKALISEANDAERIVGFRLPGAVIGLAEPEQQRWLRTVIALEDTWLCRIPTEALDYPTTINMTG